MFANYYYILGIPHTANNEEIKKAYRIKAKLYHPDVNKNANANLNFQLINEAYHILIDAEKRRLYDYKWKTRYGLSFHNRYNNTQNTEKKYYYRPNNTQYYYKKKDAKIEKTFIDNALFYLLIVVAIFSFVMGIVRLFYKEWEGIDSLSGLLLGMWLLFLLLTGWNYIKKEQ